MEQIPVSVAIKNFKKDLIDVINHSGLHISVIDMIFREVYSEIKETKMQVEANEENSMHKNDEPVDGENVMMEAVENEF